MSSTTSFENFSPSLRPDDALFVPVFAALVASTGARAPSSLVALEFAFADSSSRLAFAAAPFESPLDVATRSLAALASAYNVLAVMVHALRSLDRARRVAMRVSGVDIAQKRVRQVNEPITSRLRGARAREGVRTVRARSNASSRACRIVRALRRTSASPCALV